TAQAHRGADGSDSTLRGFLAEQVFASQQLTTLDPDEAGMAGHAQWLTGYRAALPVERLAGELLD
ncbi:MAG: ATPase, partial [Brachybacterium sp.]|nr:ATPase [Brachybacterium sp.]